MTLGRLRVAIIGPSRFGIAEPYAGGLEAHTAELARALGHLGHSVTTFAGPHDAPRPADLCVQPVVFDSPDYDCCERIDNAMPPGRWQGDDDSYRRVLAAVAETGRFDVVHNNSLHYLPVVLDHDVEVPFVHTVHTPPFDHLASAHRHRRCRDGRRGVDPSGKRLGNVVAVSAFLASTWGALVDEVVHNGSAMSTWPMGPGGTTRCVWMGRIVPEKAPHLAIDAARLAGRSITLAGPIHHPGYWAAEVAPRLGPDACWDGHLATADLAALCRTAAVGVVTPTWDEPFGLVIAEMLASGLPVAAFARGATPELLAPGIGVLATAGDVADLARAIDAAAQLDRSACRRFAVANLSATAMAQRYVDLYRRTIGEV